MAGQQIMEYNQTGYWWFISEPAERFYGTLTFDPQEGGNLVITVPKKIAQSFWGKNKLETIHGETIRGRKISLFNCYKDCVLPARLREKFCTGGYDRLSTLRRRITDGAAVHSRQGTKH